MYHRMLGTLADIRLETRDKSSESPNISAPHDFRPIQQELFDQINPAAFVILQLIKRPWPIDCARSDRWPHVVRQALLFSRLAPYNLKTFEETGSFGTGLKSSVPRTCPIPKLSPRALRSLNCREDIANQYENKLTSRQFSSFAVLNLVYGSSERVLIATDALKIAKVVISQLVELIHILSDQDSQLARRRPWSCTALLLGNKQVALIRLIRISFVFCFTIQHNHLFFLSFFKEFVIVEIVFKEVVVALQRLASLFMLVVAGLGIGVCLLVVTLGSRKMLASRATFVLEWLSPGIGAFRLVARSLSLLVDLRTVSIEGRNLVRIMSDEQLEDRPLGIMTSCNGPISAQGVKFKRENGTCLPPLPLATG
jgi:hypothetical protein